MLLQARIFMQICQKLRFPGWLQGIIALAPCCLPASVFSGRGYAFDVCKSNDTHQSTSVRYVIYIFSWIFRNFGEGCPVYQRWIQWYIVFYVLCFHYLRSSVKALTDGFSVFGRRLVLPRGRTWSAL